MATPIEIYENLYVGNEQHYEGHVAREANWATVHACKYPYHRSLVGYTNKIINTHPNYLFIEKDNRLALNMIDGPDPKYTSHELIDAALGFISKNILAGKKVLVHCNQGQSRGPSIGLLYLLKYTDTLPKTSLIDAEKAYKTLYPIYQPMNGIRGYIEVNFQRFVS